MTDKKKDARPAKRVKTWRDRVPVHPAADAFPMLSAAERRVLGEDIEKNGLKVPVVLWLDRDGSVYVLDGRNRLDATEEVGVQTFVNRLGHGVARVEMSNGDPYVIAASLNAYRRHLTSDQKRVAVAALLKHAPERSDRQVAKAAGVDHKTVGRVRREVEATGEIPHSEQHVGADGRVRKAAADPIHWRSCATAKREVTLVTAEALGITPAEAARVQRPAVKAARQAACEVIDQGGSTDDAREAAEIASANVRTDLSDLRRKQNERQKEERKNRSFFLWSEIESKANKTKRLVAEIVPLVQEGRMTDEMKGFLGEDLSKIEEGVRFARLALTGQLDVDPDAEADVAMQLSELDRDDEGTLARAARRGGAALGQLAQPRRLPTQAPLHGGQFGHALRQPPDVLDKVG